MSYDNFNYNDALDSIKANLFDIYENQERIIGSIEDDELRQKQVNDYIKVKDSAIKLIEDIEKLYNKEDNQIENVESSEENQTIKEPNELENTDNISSEEFNEEDEALLPNEDDQIEQNEDVEQKTSFSDSLPKFYLDDRNGTKPNYAYVPPALLSNIIQNGKTKITNESVSQVNDTTVYKLDDEKPKGIIVRNDQYIKLALSKLRQKSVLEDAKKYRIEQAAYSKKKMLEEEEKQQELKLKDFKGA